MVPGKETGVTTRLHYVVTDHLAVAGQIRLYHISHVGLDRPNASVNSSVYLLDISYFL